MPIERVIVKNYRALQDVDVKFNRDLNIIVGDNETGKSTLLEAINLALTCQLSRRAAHYELHPFLFNVPVVDAFIEKLRNGEKPAPPEILIELYFFDDNSLADLRGLHNSLGVDAAGISLKIELDFETFAAEYKEYVSEPAYVTSVPIEYYHIEWLSFAGNAVRPQERPVSCAFVDPSAITSNYGAHKYIIEIVRDYLDKKQRVDLALSYRKMKDTFLADGSVAAINAALKDKTGEVTDKTLSVSMDTTTRASWETGVIPHLDAIPLPLVGKGEQNSIKIKLAVEAEQACDVLLLEEPENHLTHINLNGLISHLQSRLADKQAILTTHSSFVLNKLGVEKIIMFDGAKGASIAELPATTVNYFRKAPGHDTLRMILAPKSILVEGPSDELVVQRAFRDKYQKLPIESGVEVVSVRALAFKRFLDIAALLKLSVVVVTDNDGKPDKVAEKYADYAGHQNIKICYSTDAALRTLEPQLLAANGRNKLNTVLGRNDDNDDALLSFMEANKSECALRFLDTEEAVTIPQYIQDAI